MEKISTIKIEDYFDDNGALLLRRKTPVNILLRLSVAVNDIANRINEHQQARGEDDPK